MDWIENGVFGANFQLKQRAYFNDRLTQGKKVRKLTLKRPIINKLFKVKNCKIGYTYGKNLEQKSVLK